MTADASLADDFKTTPYWWEAAPPEPADGTPLAEDADVAIVGSGYCGLSAALELARNGLRVAVLEADDLGIGASTRSGGMVTGGQKFVVSGALAGYDAQRAGRILEDARASLEHIETLIAAHGLDADYVRCGRLIAAWTPAHYARLERWAELLRRHTQATVSLVPRARLAEEIGGDYYHGGLLIEDYGGLHPAKYHRALRDCARRHGARLHGHAEVRAIERDGDRFVLRSARGDVRAREVFLATNGYSGGAVPFLARRVLPVASYIIATEPLPEELTRRLSPRRRMFSDTKRDLFYFRLSPDGTRVLFGARPSARDLPERAAAGRSFALARAVWPELRGYRLSHCWTGNVGMTADHVPHMGVHDGAHYAVGCNGSGVAMMTYLGHQTALRILGRQNRPCAFEGLDFPAAPLRFARPWLVPAAAVYYRFRDWIDGLRR